MLLIKQALHQLHLATAANDEWENETENNSEYLIVI